MNCSNGEKIRIRKGFYMGNITNRTIYCFKCGQRGHPLDDIVENTEKDEFACEIETACDDTVEYPALLVKMKGCELGFVMGC